jgi:hypothetical protein
MLTSGVLLARKWGDAAFEREAADQLRQAGWAVPERTPAAVPPAWRAVADFTRGFSFSDTRW